MGLYIKGVPGQWSAYKNKNGWPIATNSNLRDLLEVLEKFGHKGVPIKNQKFRVFVEGRGTVPLTELLEPPKAPAEPVLEQDGDVVMWQCRLIYPDGPGVWTECDAAIAKQSANSKGTPMESRALVVREQNSAVNAATARLLGILQKHWQGCWFRGVTKADASEINQVIRDMETFRH